MADPGKSDADTKALRSLLVKIARDRRVEFVLVSILTG